MGYRVQLLLHCHCLFLSALTLLMTICKIRSAFMFTIAILFYTNSLIINLATKLHNKRKLQTTSGGKYHNPYTIYL